MKTMVALATLLVPMSVFASPGERAIRDLPSMTSSRAAHTATALADGSVLVVGGFTAEEGQLAGVELFDPERLEFRPIDDAITRRHSHTAALLPDGNVLIAGGYGARTGTLDTAERFDPATRRFSLAGRMNARRAEHTSIALPDGRVALIGGRGVDWSTLASIEIYDPTTGTFSEGGQLAVPRSGHVSILLRDGRIFIAGGHAGRGATLTIYDSAEIFDPRSGRSVVTANIGSIRHKLDGVLLADGRVLLTGGSSEDGPRSSSPHAEIYDPSRGRFVAAANMNESRYKHRGSSLLLPNGTVLIGGGARQAELYDPATDAFTLLAGGSPLHGSFSTVVLLKDDRVLIAGGYFRPDSPTNRAWIFCGVTSRTNPAVRSCD
jgi:hypothetical protein